ncbi:MAG: hypothetical protein WCP91_02225 [Candidatus Berkelbacteria bacterium]
MKNIFQESKIYLNFLNILKILNQIQVTPIVYGSLGLALQINEEIQVNDIDLLLTREDDNKFQKLISVLINNSFKIDPDHCREFSSADCIVSAIALKEIEELIKNRKIELIPAEINGLKFYNLTLPIHKQIYEIGLNKLRKVKKERSDTDKINLIAKHIAQK